MAESKQNQPDIVEIRRYSNRRFYDTSQSKHVTLEQIREIVQEGRNVRITDIATGEDITSRILTQIILDYDDEKITAFPAAMLHRLIRSSESLLREFMGQSFDNATRVFQDSQRSAGEQLNRMAEMAPGAKDAAQWWQGAFDGVVPPWGTPGAGAQAKPGAGGSSEEMERVVNELREQLKSVQDELKTMREASAGGAGNAGASKRSASARKRG